MNFIYDICLNFNDKLYDFFEWNKNDMLMHIKKIPIFKISVDNFNNFVNYKFKIDSNILKSVHNKTEIFNSHKKIEFCALFCDDNNIIAIEFDKNGMCITKSYLYIDEEFEVLEESSKNKITDINYTLIKYDKPILKTRKQIYIEKFINNELKNSKKEKLNYIYFECFNKKSNSKQYILKQIKKLNYTSNEYINLYNILKLTSR